MNHQIPMRDIPSPVASSVADIRLEAKPLPSFKTGISGVFRYEWGRTLTPVRIGLWIAMVLFPVVLTIAIRLMLRARESHSEDYLIVSIMLFILLPEVITILCMLLWATPIVNAELESQTWAYAVVRPKGRRSLLLGKYFVAVLWTGLCTSTAASIAIPISGVSNAFRVWAAIAFLCWLSAIAYGALYMLIGVFVQRRAMVIAFAYTMFVEFLLATIPAVVNKMTISRRLWSILYDCFDLPKRMVAERFSSDDSGAIVNTLVLLLATALMIGIGLWRIESTQYKWQSEA